MKWLPRMVGTVDRRLIINYRVDADVLARILPEPFKPQLVRGAGLAGICLIRLSDLRPAGYPAALGLTTENAAHRIAVEWDGPEGHQQGVYIPRRDTSSRLTTLIGGRVFPGEHHRATFRVSETESHYDVAFASTDGTASVVVSTQVTSDLSAGSIFRSLDEASGFFENGPLGYSVTRRPGRYDGVELRCGTWRVEPLRVTHAASSFFEDTNIFPTGTAVLDSGLLMRGIPATWHGSSLSVLTVKAAV
jgi:hypothetical protein